jgi:SSS family solute:Na+ symporter
MFTLVKVNHAYLAVIALSPDAKEMAENLYRALWSWLICFLVTVDYQLKGLVWGLTDLPSEAGIAIYKRPVFWAFGVGVFFVILQWMFW